MQGQPVRGFDIRYRAAGDAWMCRKLHAWSPVDTLPEEWTQICDDKTVEQAVCFLSSEARKRSDKRRLSAEFTRH